MAESNITVDGLTAAGAIGAVLLTWNPAVDPHVRGLPYLALDVVEVHRSSSNNLDFAVQVGDGITSFFHAGLSRGEVGYYWIRPRNKAGGYGEWYPSSPTAGIVGTESNRDLLLGIPGYWKTPPNTPPSGGLIFQWANLTTVAPDATGSITWRTAYPSACIWTGPIATPMLVNVSGSIVAFPVVASVVSFDRLGAVFQTFSQIDVEAGQTTVLLRPVATTINVLSIGY